MHSEILKQNEYKCVECVVDEQRGRHVLKRYAGHPEPSLEFNARYSHRALEYLKARFTDIVHSPEPYGLAPERFEVAMEFLPDLENADRLSVSTLPLAAPFFRRCYEIRGDEGFLVDVRGSVVANDAIMQLIETGFPISLGFRGDLHENLRVHDDSRLVIADVDSICVEPLGLSELVLYVDLLASSNVVSTFWQLRGGLPRPVAAEHLDARSLDALFEAALSITARNAGHLPSGVRTAKFSLARWLFQRGISSA